MPRYADSDEHPALAASQKKGFNVAQREIADRELQDITSIKELWSHLTVKQKKLIAAFPKYDTLNDAIRDVIAPKIGPASWIYTQRRGNPYFVKAIELRKESQDIEVMELIEMDMRVLLTVQSYEFVLQGGVPDKDKLSLMKRLASKITTDDLKEVSDNLNLDNVVGF